MTGFTTCAVFIFKTKWSCTLSLDGIKPTHLKRQLTLALDLMVTMSVAVNTSPIQESNHIPHALIDLSTLFFSTFYMDKLGKIHLFRWKVICWKLTKIYLLNPSHPEIKISILIFCPYLFPTEVGGEFDKISSKFVLSDPVRDSHDHSVLQSIDIQEEIWCWWLLGL